MGDGIYCRYCCEPFENDDVSPDGKGFWCNACEGYTFFDPAAEYPRFTLLLEGKADQEARSVIRTKLNKRLSLLRYPGGKSKIIDHIYTRLNPDKCNKLVSPYAGGASAELALLHGGAVQKLVLNDIDFGVYSLHRMVKEFPEALILEIRYRIPNHDDFMRSREVIKSGYHGCDLFDAAWHLLLVNRLAFSGIYKANPLGGLRGGQEQLLSRWNPDDLCRRIQVIHGMSDRITVLHQDALQVIEDEYWNDTTTIFLDPPYVKQGKHLYRYFYNKHDHYDLEFLLDSLYKEFPCADLLLCYDDCHFIESIYQYPSIERIQRRFSA